MLTLQKQRNKKRIFAVLDRLLSRNIRLLQPVIDRWLKESIARIRRDISEAFAKDVAADITTTLSYWEEIKDNGVRAIKPVTLTIIGNGAQEAYKIAEVAGVFDVLNVEAVRLADKICAKLVVEVTDETKAGIKTFIREGIKEGKAMPKIGRELRDLVGLTERQIIAVGNYKDRLIAEHPDWLSARVDKNVDLYRLKLQRYRTEMIARTETAKAQSEGFLFGMQEVGVEKVEWLTAPGCCDECDALNGKKFTLEEAEGMLPKHPNCRCSFAPVI